MLDGYHYMLFSEYAALRAERDALKEQVEQANYRVQVHSDVLGETVHKYEKQVADLTRQLEKLTLQRAERKTRCRTKT